MWLDYMHDENPYSDGKRGRSNIRAVADFARLQQTLIQAGRKRGETDAQILETIEECILGAILHDRR